MISGVIPQESPNLLFVAGTEIETLGLLIKLAIEPQESIPFCLYSAGIPSARNHVWLLIWVLRIPIWQAVY